MAVGNIFNKAKGTVSGITGGIANTGSENRVIRELKKNIEEKVSNKSKIFGYIGMEAYDLHAGGKLQMQELQGYFDKIDQLDEEIKELQAKIQASELQNGNGTTCVCGARLTAQDKFCPNCGAPVDNGMITCVCGNQVRKDARFCNNCGNDIQQMLANGGVPVTAASGQGTPVSMQPNVQPKRTIQCICGAEVPEGKFMCMECGRRVEE